MQLNKRRAGTHSVLNRKNMTGGGKKPHRQKGTGRARAGSSNSPLWVGGAVTHGPSPRSYEFKLNKKTKRAALAAVFSDKRKNSELILVDELNLKEGKTKELISILDKLKIADQKVFILLPETNELVSRASSNIPGVKAGNLDAVNIYDLVNAKYVLATKSGIEKLQANFSKQEG
ncbi:UNVERIFIED_CONTAM: hypothetical protein GTU68_056331 [Idotea baltica]|nr:hypothetical protein [Idotea baltica]